MALTVHLGWLVFPVLAVVAFLPKRRMVLAAIVAVSALLALHDANPLFWASFGVGLIVVAGCIARLRSDERFLACWVLIFFGASLIGAYAGAERYLLPIAAPIAILAARALANRRRWLIAGCRMPVCVSLALAVMNYQHWDAYREFVAAHRDEIQTHRTWVAAEWGLRFYAESEGALPLLTIHASSPAISCWAVRSPAFTGRSGHHASIDVVPPFRCDSSGCDAHSGFSVPAAASASSTSLPRPLDVIRLQRRLIASRRVSWLPMNSPASAYQIVAARTRSKGTHGDGLAHVDVPACRPPGTHRIVAQFLCPRRWSRAR